MPDHPVQTRYNSADELDDADIGRAVLLSPGVRAALFDAQRSNTIDPRDARIVAKLLPRVPKPTHLDQREAFNVFIAAEILRLALRPREPQDPIDLGQAEDIKAEELPDEQPHLDGGLGRAD